MAIRDGALRIGAAGRQRGSKQAPGFLPSGTGDFFRKRVIEICGLALFGLAAAILLACLTFNAADPSFNRAAQGPALNLLGMAGAHGADLLLQSLGLATLMLPLVLAGWGWRLTRRHLLDHWWLRLAAVALLLPLAGAALAALPTPASWPAGDSLGGFVGVLLLSWATLAMALDSWIFAGVAGLLATAGFAYALGLSAAEWRALGRAASWTLGGAGRGLYGLARKPGLLAQAILGLSFRRAEGHDGPEGGTEDRTVPRLGGAPASSSAGGPESEDEIDSFAQGSLRRSTAQAKSGLIAPRKRRTVFGKRGRQAGQRRLDFGPGPGGGYELPPLALLAVPEQSGAEPELGRDALERNARLLETVGCRLVIGILNSPMANM